MSKNIAVGILRPPHVFFYEVDVKKGQFRKTKERLKMFCFSTLKKFFIRRTKRGYHIIGYPYRKTTWSIFRWIFPSDFTKKLRKRWGKRNPQVLRIDAKWTNDNFANEVSPKPKLIYGNFFLTHIQKYKVMYYAK